MPFCSRSAADWALAGIPQSSVATSAVARCLMVMTVDYKANVTELLPRCPLLWGGKLEGVRVPEISLRAWWGRMVSCAPVGNRRWVASCTRRQAGYQPAAGCQPAPQGGTLLAAAVLSLALLVSCTRVRPNTAAPVPPQAVEAA